MYTKAQFTP